MSSPNHSDDAAQPALFDAPEPPAAPGAAGRSEPAPEQPSLFDPVPETIEVPRNGSTGAASHGSGSSGPGASKPGAAPASSETPRSSKTVTRPAPAPRGSVPGTSSTGAQAPSPANGTVANGAVASGVVAAGGPWHEGPRACFDLETTGRDPQQARIVTASVVLVSPAGEVQQEWEWLADPGIEIPEEAAAVHGVSTERARAEGRPAAEVTSELGAVLAGFWRAGIPVLAFNAAYDLTVLTRETERHGLPAPEPFPVLDPFVLNKQVHRYRRGKRTLGALCEEYGVVLDAAHTSAADALATERLAAALADRFAELRQPAAALHEAQIGWAAEQAASLQEYFRRKDPAAVVDGTWPVHPRP